MDGSSNLTRDVAALIAEMRENLLRAQELGDLIDPASIIGARIQHVIDDLEPQLMRGLRRNAGRGKAD